MRRKPTRPIKGFVNGEERYLYPCDNCPGLDRDKNCGYERCEPWRAWFIQEWQGICADAKAAAIRRDEKRAKADTDNYKA